MSEERDRRRGGLVALLVGGVLVGGLLAIRSGPSCAGTPVPEAVAVDASASAVIASAAPSTSGPAAAAASPFLYAEVTIDSVPEPERLAAPLPRSLAEFQQFLQGGPGFRLRQAVEDLVCVGSPRVLKELEEAALAAARSGAAEADLGASYGLLFARCRDEGACEWARRVAKAPDLAALRAVAFMALVPCTGDDVEDLFEATNVPPTTLIERHFRAAKPPRYSAALDRAASRLISTGTLEDVRRAALVLGGVQDPRAAAVLLDLQSETHDPERAAAIALALGRQSDPRARAAFRRACEQHASDPLCILDSGDAAVVDAGSEAPADLRRCVEDRENTDRDRHGCYEKLARVERWLATDMARSLRASPDPWMSELATTLILYPTTQALQHRLVALGLLEASVGPAPDHLTARALLRAAGRVTGFEAETRRRPMGHDSILRRMAARSDAALAEVAFEETSPESDAAAAIWQIQAYVGGRRLSVRLNLTDDCYDVRAMVGLLNVLARDLRSPQRFVPLASNDEGAWVVVGPETGLREALGSGLLRSGSGEHSHAH